MSTEFALTVPISAVVEYTKGLVTPAVAMAWLQANTCNRALRSGKVEAYARDMADGKWPFNGDPIRFSIDGVLLDGQHRLTALIVAGVSLEFFVISGLPPEAQETMDMGVHRTMGDALSLRGEHNSKTLAAVTRRVIGYDLGTGRDAPTYQEMGAYLAEHPDLRRAVDVAVRAQSSLPASPSSVGAAFHICARLDTAVAEDFFITQVIDGLGLTAGQPATVLRNRMTSEALSGHRMDGDDVMRFSFLAWNHHRAGRQVSRLQSPRGGWTRETFPHPR